MQTAITQINKQAKGQQMRMISQEKYKQQLIREFGLDQFTTEQAESVLGDNARQILDQHPDVVTGNGMWYIRS